MVLEILLNNLNSVIPQLRYFNNVKRHMLLSTDMSLHDDIMKQYKDRVTYVLSDLYCRITNNSLEEFYRDFDNNMLEYILERVFNESDNVNIDDDIE